VQVRCFLIQGGADPIVRVKSNGDVQKVHAGGQWCVVPFQTKSSIVHVFFESPPRSIVGGRVSNLPNAKDIINIASVEREIGQEPRFLKQFLFQDAIIESGIVGGWWCTHGSSLELLPIGVTTDEIVMSHDDFETIDGGF